MALWMNLGTINVVNGSKAVTGVGTKFKTAPIPAREGQPIVINNVHYEIGSVNSDTSITLALNYAGATANNLAYTIITTAEGSFNDLSRRAAQVMSLYQGYMDVYDALFSGTGNVTVTLPDGGVITLPSWNTMQPKDGTLTTLSGKPTTAFGLARLNDADAAAQRAALALGSASQREALGAGPLYSQDSILGIVSHHYGDPRGAIFERGGSGNNTYVKFADGTLICQVVSLGGVISGAGVLVNLTWYFPATPVGIYNVIPSWTIEAGYNKGTLQVQTKTSQTVRILCEVTSGVSGYVDAVLIGRWY
jgi:hypothetical protein